MFWSLLRGSHSRIRKAGFDDFKSLGSDVGIVSVFVNPTPFYSFDEIAVKISRRRFVAHGVILGQCRAGEGGQVLVLFTVVSEQRDEFRVRAWLLFLNQLSDCARPCGGRSGQF